MVMRDAKARSEAKLVGVQQTGRPAVLAADKRDQLAVFDGQISEWMGGRVYVMQRTHVLIPEAHFDSRVGCETPAILHIRVGIPLAEVHGGNTIGLALAHGGQAEFEARERITRPVAAGG